MIQRSTISLTQADACVAIAYWLNATTFREPVNVKEVRTDSSNYGVTHFEIQIERETTPETNDTKEPQA